MHRCLGLLGRRIGARVRAWAVASAVGLVAVGWSPAVEAAPFELEWSAPEGCPTREAILDTTYARLGKARADDPPGLFVRGDVAAVDRGFTVTLVLEDVTGRSVGERTVRVGDSACAAIETPASVVLAMMIAVARPRAVAPAPRATPADPPAPAPSPPPSSPAPSSPAPSPPPPAPPSPALPPTGRSDEATHRLSVGAAAVGSTGALPNVGLGAGINATYGWGPWFLLRFEASVEAGGSVRAAGGEVRFTLFSAAARAGVAALRTDHVVLAPTVGARAGLIRTSAVELAAPQSESLTLGTLGPGLLMRVALGRSLILEGALDVELILRRDHFHVRERGGLKLIHEPSLFAPRVAMGLAYEFR